MESGRVGQIALDEYTQFVPPGWKPGIKGYSFKNYQEKIDIWMRIKNTDDNSKAAALIISRLQGEPYQTALTFKVQRGENTYVSTAAICLKEQEAVAASHGTAAVPAYPSGLSLFMAKLQEDYRLHDHDEQMLAMDAFFDLKQRQLDLNRYITEYERLYDEASTKAGLNINDNGRTTLLLRGSNLHSKKIDELLLKIDGDMSKYKELTTIMKRIGKREQASHSSNYAEEYDEYDYENDETYWIQDADGTWYQDDWYEDEWSEATWYQG